MQSSRKFTGCRMSIYVYCLAALLILSRFLLSWSYQLPKLKTMNKPLWRISIIRFLESLVLLLKSRNLSFFHSLSPNCSKERLIFANFTTTTVQLPLSTSFDNKKEILHAHTAVCLEPIPSFPSQSSTTISENRAVLSTKLAKVAFLSD